MFDQPIYIYVLGAVALYFVARFMFQQDEKIEDRRRAASDISKWCHSNGLSFLCPILDDYTVGDYSSLLHRIRQLAEHTRNTEAVNGAVDGFLNRQLDKHLSDPVLREKFIATIEKKMNVTIPREFFKDAKVLEEVIPEKVMSPGHDVVIPGLLDLVKSFINKEVKSVEKPNTP